MVNTKITDFTEKATGAATDEFVINDVAGGNVDKKMGMDGLRLTESQITDLQAYITSLAADTTPQLGGNLDGQGNDQTKMGTISMTEQAAANVDVVADGQLWVKTAVPNELWFTDDAGTDFQLAHRSNNLSVFAATTSAQLAGIMSDETGSGLLVFGTSPTLITPILGIPTSGTLTNCTGLPITGITSSTSAEIATLCSDETGSGLLVFGTSPTFVTPALGTPASGVMTNMTGLTLAGMTTDAKKQSIIVAASDETTVLTTGTAKTTFRMPYAFTLNEVRASLTTAGTGAALVTVDINETGTTVLSTKITVDATEKTSETAATAPVISDSALADDAEITIDIDTIDTDNVATGLKVYLIGVPV